MANLDAVILSDTTQMLGDFGESIQFRPKGASARSITALVRRYTAESVPGTTSGFAPYADVWIKNHATLGASSITIGGDDIELAPRKGGDAVWFSIAKLIDQEAGFWHVRIWINR